MGRLKSAVVFYLIACGIAMHLAAGYVYLFKYNTYLAIRTKALTSIAEYVPGVAALNDALNPSYDLADDIAANFAPWTPLASRQLNSTNRVINAANFGKLKDASETLQDGDTLLIPAGRYTEGFAISANNVSVVGDGHVIFDSAVTQNKATIVLKGNNTRVVNIECSGVKVKDGNGACIRLEGQDLTLEHSYFHNSQQGILSSNGGKIIVRNSRFESLGAGGRAHSIYVGGDILQVENSLFIAAKDEGHAIKSRMRHTVVSGSVITSLSSDDSRLIDVNGESLLITHSILHQGPKSTNGDAIAFGLEKTPSNTAKVELLNNLILLERERPNVLLHAASELKNMVAEGNTVISREEIMLPGINLQFRSRKEAGLAPYPALPDIAVFRK